MTVEDTQLVTRNWVRAKGLDVSNTSFNRYEKAGLLDPHKVDGRRSGRVYYRLDQVNALFSRRGGKPPHVTL